MIKGKLNSIQYLRGLAALTVVVAHSWDHPLAQTPALAGALGELGVVLFFVISGFIMVAITGEGRFAWGDFLKRRAIRIVPLYWLATLLTAAFALAVPALFRSTAFSWQHLLLSLLFVPHAAPDTGSFSPILALGWTLNYEVWFYICFAALAGLLARNRVIALTLFFSALAVLGLLFAPHTAAAQFYTGYAPLAFCIGCWIGLATVNGTLLRLPRVANALVLVVGIAGLVVGLLIGEDAAAPWQPFIGFAVFAGSLVFLGLRVESRLPQVKALVAIGDASYAMYLIHMFIVGAVVAVAAKLLPVTHAPILVALVAGCVALATVVALLVHVLIEKPALRVLHGTLTPRARPQAAG